MEITTSDDIWSCNDKLMQDVQPAAHRVRIFTVILRIWSSLAPVDACVWHDAAHAMAKFADTCCD